MPLGLCGFQRPAQAGAHRLRNICAPFGRMVRTRHPQRTGILLLKDGDSMSKGRGLLMSRRGRDKEHAVKISLASEGAIWYFMRVSPE